MDPAAALATNVRRIRTARGLSLSDLARRAGVAKATLVGLESGRGNPTVSTLRSLADELGVAIEQLLTDAAAPALHVARAGEGSVIRGEGADVRFVHRTPIGGAMLELYELVVHRRHDSPPHPAGVLEQITVTEGQLDGHGRRPDHDARRGRLHRVQRRPARTPTTWSAARCAASC